MNNIRMARKQVGMTAKQLGEAVGVSEAAISHYETGKRQPSFEVFLKIKETNVLITKKKKTQPDPQKLKAKLGKLTDLYLDDLITKEKYEVEYNCVQAKIAEAEKEPQEVNASELKTLLGAYQGLTRPGKKAFWSRLVNRIDIDGDTINFTLFYT